MTLSQKAARAAAAKAFKAHKVALRKGHWRLPGPEVTWYVDLRAAAPRPDAELSFEVGAWLPALDQPEPEAGAVDCPLLADVPLRAEDPGTVADQVGRLVALLGEAGTRAGLDGLLAAGGLPTPLIDRPLAELLGRGPG
ncbi:MAG: hypothetical protein QM638_19640 [Nocardioides sp.]|uniref:hypothetical protein n=1 Tax=Nocardioides sp. TaxID=35761 RepID=UPI0039E6AF24